MIEKRLRNRLIREEKKKGKTYRALSVEYNLSISTLYRIIKKD
jgi:Mor family transcriptional regulator